MSASFSKHTFPLSIFRTVTCNKAMKERRRSCVSVSDLDPSVDSLSVSGKKNPPVDSKRFFFSSFFFFFFLVMVHLFLFVLFCFFFSSRQMTTIYVICLEICPSCPRPATAAVRFQEAAASGRKL